MRGSLSPFWSAPCSRRVAPGPPRLAHKGAAAQESARGQLGGDIPFRPLPVLEVLPRSVGSRARPVPDLTIAPLG
jgi:hypothetical protein